MSSASIMASIHRKEQEIQECKTEIGKLEIKLNTTHQTEHLRRAD